MPLSKPLIWTKKWKNDVAQGARVLLKETYVKASDPHMDAKVFPHMHP